MYFCYLHGLCCSSDLPFPNLLTCPDRIHDVVIRFGRVDDLLKENEIIARGDNFRITDKGIFVFHLDDLILYFRRGEEIVIQQNEEVDEGTVAAIILDHMPILLHQRGRLVLHASSVAHGDNAFVFAGESGKGKSTLAMMLHAKGYTLVSDDIVSIEYIEGYPYVIPAFPEVNVWPETLTSLSFDPSEFRPVRPNTEKRSVPITTHFTGNKIPLRAVYILEPGRDAEIVRLAPKEAIFHLIRNSYRAELAEGNPVTVHLENCGKIVNLLPVYQVSYIRSDQSIGLVADLVEQNLSTCVIQ